MKLKFSGRNFEKMRILKLKSVQSNPSGSMNTKRRRDGRADTHEEANSRFSQFWEGA